jgi:hypothetical protein
MKGETVINMQTKYTGSQFFITYLKHQGNINQQKKKEHFQGSLGATCSKPKDLNRIAKIG